MTRRKSATSALEETRKSLGDTNAGIENLRRQRTDELAGNADSDHHCLSNIHQRSSASLERAYNLDISAHLNVDIEQGRTSIVPLSVLPCVCLQKS